MEQGAGSFIEVLVKEERVPEDAIADAFTERLKVPRARVAAFLLDEEALRKVPERLARKHQCLPLAIEGRLLVVAMVDPIDYLAIRDIEFAAASTVKAVAAGLSEVLAGIDERYGAEDRIGTFLANVPEAPDIQIMSEENAELSMDVANSVEAAEVAPVVKMCNLVIYDALKAGASDVHIEPALHDLQVRMRVDGVLRDYTRVPKWLHGPVVSRLKILAKLDIAERRLPQDGRVNVHYQGGLVDLRVSTLPTHFGEKMVLRILGGTSAPALDTLGLSPIQQTLLETAVAQPQGMILVTGPTGSGKTTTLYALLAKHHKPEVNIVTVEDPIEYQLAGINQVQVNPKAGLTFASALRSILRQDPDVILVGEMRDRETVEIACQAAMTGHMVLSTLHTNSAVARRHAHAGPRRGPGGAGLVAHHGDRPAAGQAHLQRVPRGIRSRRRRCGTARASSTTRCPSSGATAAPPAAARGSPAASPCTKSTGRPTRSGSSSTTAAARPTCGSRRGRPAWCPCARTPSRRSRPASPRPTRCCASCRWTRTRCPAPDARRSSRPTSPRARTAVGASRRTARAAARRCASTGNSARTATRAPCSSRSPTKPTPRPSLPRRSPARSRMPPLLDEAQFERRTLVPTRRKGPGRRSTCPRNRRTRSSLAWIWTPESGSPLPRPAPARTPVVAPAPAPPPAPAAGRACCDSSRTSAGRADSSAAVPAPQAQRTVDPAASRRSLRVLVVDDDPDIRMIVSATLRKLDVPVDVVQAEDGVQAVEKARAATPDLVVLDVMMPRMDGFETCRALREDVRTAFVPILMLTASADQDSRTKGYLIGTDDYMAKPFLPVDLKLRIARLLRRTYGI